MHMAFLSRGFKNLQWYSMTNIKDACRRLFYLVDLGEHRLFANSMTTALIKRDGGTRKRFPHHTAPSLAVE